MSEAVTERVALPGPRGALCAELAYGVGEPAVACLLLNPHPHMGGRMSNNVIAHLAGELAERGAATLRFDYAGVGESEGATPDVMGSMMQFWSRGCAPEDPLMVQDAAAALQWLRAELALPVVLIGYSFGSQVASRLCASHVAGVVAIAPTLKQHDLAGFAASRLPKLVLYSDNDFATPRGFTEAWLAALAEPAEVYCVAGGEHFFRGREGELAHRCTAFLRALRATEVSS